MKNDVTISANIVDRILNMINRGTLKPGDKLPSERMLAELLSVSRVSVREALKMLSAMKIISIVPREGTFINKLLAEDIFNQKISWKLLGSSSLHELFEVRKFIEPNVAEAVALRGSEQDVEMLEQMVQHFHQELTQEPEYYKKKYIKDIKFHLELCRAARNKVLFGMMSTVTNLLVEAYKLNIKIKGAGQRAYKGHSQIMQAIKTKDHKKAREAMLKHLNDSEEDFVKGLQLSGDKNSPGFQPFFLDGQ